MNCDSDKNTCDFLELILSFSFLPRIVKPTRITPRSQILIDSIFFNEIQANIIVGNITTDISDHLTQFVAMPGDWHTEISTEDIYRRNYKNLNPDNFKDEFGRINWGNLFLDKNIDDAYDSFLEETEKLINKHFPLAKVSKRKLKQQIRKPWISNDLMRQINYKNKLHKKSKTEKDMNIKNELANEHKILQRTLRKKVQLEINRYYQVF